MQINGFILVRKSDSAEMGRWPTLPSLMHLPNGDTVFGVTVDWQNSTYNMAPLTYTVADPVPPTLDQIYDQTIITQQVLKAVVLSLNDGTLPVGTNKTVPQLKVIIKGNM